MPNVQTDPKQSKRRNIWRVLAVCFLCFVWLFGGLGVWNVSSQELEPHYYIIELKNPSDETDRELRRDLRDQIREVRRLSDRLPREYRGRFGESKRASDLRRWRVVEIEPNELEETLEKLKNNPAVISLRPEKVYKTAAIPNDPYFLDQYSLAGVHTAWDKTKGSGSTVIAVIDAGVDPTHEDLQGKFWRNSRGHIGWDFVEEKPSTYAHDHATHVAGIAAASSNNGKGVAGVNWGAKIMSVRALSRSGYAREEWVIQAIDYAVEQGADIINMSIAGSASELMQDAIENAYANGVVVVAAAGNNGANTDYYNVFPACADKNGVNMVIGVGASDDDREGASFSNYGRCVDVSAPGKRILSTEAGNDYGKMSGTSMSSPYVAGAAGLYLAQHPGASPAQVLNAMRNSLDSFAGRRADRDNERLKGILNIAKLVGVSGFLPLTPTPSPSSEDEGTPPRTGGEIGEPNLTISLFAPGTATRGKTIVYKTLVKNSGSAVAKQVTVEFDGDRDIVFLPDESTAGCTPDRYDVICKIGNLKEDSQQDLELTFSLPEEELRCGEDVRVDAEVEMLERGRLREQADTDRFETEVVCE